MNHDMPNFTVINDLYYSDGFDDVAAAAAAV